MALVLANRVQESATANTTVSFTLTGAVAGFQPFTAVGNGNTTYYSATDASGNWEVGLGTYSSTGPTLTRTTVYASSNSGSAVTFSGTVNVFVTYPSDQSVNLDASGNVSDLGTVSSGTWQGSTVGVAYGGTGVTSSSGANSVVLRDANQNITVNRISQGLQVVTASGGTTVLTVASQFNQALVGTGGHTFQLPDATTLTNTTAFQFNNNATGTLTIVDFASATVGTIAPGGAAGIALLANATVAGTWDVHAYIPENVTWGTNALNLGSTVISGGTWQGGTVQPAYGGTGLTTFVGANNALYSTGSTTLTAGTLPVAAGGTGVTTSTGSGAVVLSNSPSLVTPALGTPSSGNFSSGTFTWPTFNQNTTGTAANVSGTVAIANGGTGQTTQQAAINALVGTQTANRVLRSDGTNMSLSQVALGTDVSGTLPVANGGTGLTSGTSGGVLYYAATGTLASSGALAANSLVIGGGAGVAPSTTTTGTGVVTALGVNTGTAGSFVVNGGALGTPSSGTVTNLTGTASININGTVGATTPNTGAFTSVEVNAGTVSSPSISITGDSNTGFYSSGADALNFAEGGVGSRIGYRNVPPSGTRTSAYTLTISDVGKYVQVGSGGAITIPTSTFSEGDAISIANNTTGNITITCSAPTTYVAGTNTVRTSLTLATRGVATVLFISSTVCFVTGNVT